MNASSTFYSCDWGTTTLRLRAVCRLTREVLAEVRSNLGIKTLSSAESETESVRAKRFAQVLRDNLAELRRRRPDLLRGQPHPVVVSGMASSSLGWKELPYAAVPFSLNGSDVCYERLELEAETEGSSPIPVYLLSGVSTGTDIMRGEETEILGFFSTPELAGLHPESVAILPGTHSKHLFIRNGRIVDFQTYMTGELFDVLARHSLLRVSVDPSHGAVELQRLPPGSAARATFLDGVAFVRQKGLARSLFRVRTRTVLDRADPAENTWFLSGLLIGAELDNLLMQIRADVPIILAAGPKFAAPYDLALEVLGTASPIVRISPEQVDKGAVLGHALFLEHLASSEHP